MNKRKINIAQNKFSSCFKIFTSNRYFATLIVIITIYCLKNVHENKQVIETPMFFTDFFIMHCNFHYIPLFFPFLFYLFLP